MNETYHIARRTSRASYLAAALLMGAALLTAAPTPAAAAKQEKKNDTGILEKMNQWQDRMTDTFRDTWKKLRGEEGSEALSERSLATASVDLREQKDSYIVRLNLPKKK